MKPTTTKAPKAPKVIAPVQEDSAVEDVTPTVDVEETASVDATPAPKTRGKMTTTENIRPGEVSIEQPDQARVDVTQIKKDDLVLVTMHETIDPAPRIGTFDCRHKLGVPALRAKRNYRMPKFVAEVLVDAGKAEYLSLDS